MAGERMDDEFLDRIIDSLVEQPISSGPPDEVRRRILALGEAAALPAPNGRSVFSDWMRMAAIAATLLIVVDVGWCAYIYRATPVSWFREADSDRWHVMYDNMRVELRQPPAEIRSYR